MADFITVTVLVILIGGAVAYIVKEKKRGVRCIGCSLGGCCGGSCGCNADVDAAAKAILDEMNAGKGCNCGCDTK